MKKLIALILAAVMVIGMVTVIAESSEATPAPTEEVAGTTTEASMEESSEKTEASTEESSEKTEASMEESSEKTEAPTVESTETTETSTASFAPDDGDESGSETPVPDTDPVGETPAPDVNDDEAITSDAENGTDTIPSAELADTNVDMNFHEVTWNPAEPDRQLLLLDFVMPKDGYPIVRLMMQLKNGEYDYCLSEEGEFSAGDSFYFHWNGETSYLGDSAIYGPGLVTFYVDVHIDFNDGTVFNWKSDTFTIDYDITASPEETPSPTPEVTPSPTPEVTPTLASVVDVKFNGFTWDAAKPDNLQTVAEFTMPKAGTYTYEIYRNANIGNETQIDGSATCVAGSRETIEWNGQTDGYDHNYIEPVGKQQFWLDIKFQFDDGSTYEWSRDFVVDYGTATPTQPEVDFFGFSWLPERPGMWQQIAEFTTPKKATCDLRIMLKDSAANTYSLFRNLGSRTLEAGFHEDIWWDGSDDADKFLGGKHTFRLEIDFRYDSDPMETWASEDFTVDFEDANLMNDTEPTDLVYYPYVWDQNDPGKAEVIFEFTMPKNGTVYAEVMKVIGDNSYTMYAHTDNIYCYAGQTSTCGWGGQPSSGTHPDGKITCCYYLTITYDDGTYYEWMSPEFVIDYSAAPAEPEFVFNGFTWDPDKTDNTQTLATFKLPKDGTLDWGLVDVTGGAQEGEEWVVHYTGQQCAADLEVSLNWDGLNADGTHPWGKVDYLLTLQYSYSDGTQGELITQEFTVDYGEAPADIPDVKFYDFTWDPEDPGRYMIVVEFTMPKAGTAYFEILRKNDDGSYTLHTATGHDHFESGQSGNWGWVGGTPLAHPVGKYTFKYRLSFEFDDGTTYSCESHDFDVDFPEIEPVFKLNGFTWDPNKENNSQTIATLTSPKDGTVSWGLGFDGGEVFGGDSDEPIYANVEYQFNWDGILPDGTRLYGVQNFVLTVTLEYADGSGTKEYTEKFSVDFDAVPVVKPTFNWTGLTWDPFKVDNTQTIATITLPKAGDVNWGIMDENCTLDSYTGWPEHVGKLVCPANTEVPLTWDGAYPDGSNPTGTVNYQLALWYHYDDGTQGSSNFISQDFSVTYPALADDLIESAAPEDTIHTSDEANWKLNEDGLYDHSKPQDFATIVLQEDGFIKWEIRLESSASASIATIAQVGSDIFASGSANLKAGEVYHAQWRGVNEQGWHPEGEAMFVVSVTVTSADGQRQQRWTDYYSMNYTHPSSQDVHTATSAPNTGTTGGSSGSSMPKTGDDAVPASVWLLLAACAFAGFMIVRKVRHG